SPLDPELRDLALGEPVAGEPVDARLHARPRGASAARAAWAGGGIDPRSRTRHGFPRRARDRNPRFHPGGSHVIRRLAFLAPLPSLASAACGGPQVAAGRGQALIEQTTVGKNRCQSDGDEHRLFVVEWNATDLSSFEAKASRDVVLVHYEGCTMKPL